MRSYILAAAFAVLAAAQLDLPSCALSCFEQAISNTTCGLTDYYCQCTSGQTQIQSLAIPCLCHSTCTSSDLIAVIQDSNKVCSSALSASSQTYTAATVGLGACATAGSQSEGQAAAASSTGTSAASATGTNAPTATAGTSASGSGSATQSAAQQTGSSAATANAVYGGSALGLSWLLLIAL